MSDAASPSEKPRGQPLLVFAAILGAWFALRVLLWQSPFPQLAPAHFLVDGNGPALTAAPIRTRPGHLASAHTAGPAVSALPSVPGPIDAANAEPMPPPWSATVTSAESPVVAPAESPPPVALASPAHVVGQQLLLAAAFSHMALPPEIAAYYAAAHPAAAPPAALAASVAPGARITAPVASTGHWSGDAWLLLRRDTSGPLIAGEPSYGRSQGGAVLRYRLAPASGHRPFAYARVTRAIAGPAETEVAVGLAARPLAKVPLSVAGEVRAYDGPAGREVRPAAFAVTELPPARLPLGLRGEAYLQAGYVGGRYATGFVDGQARIDTKVARLDKDSELRAGAGLWGGAQKHAARLDVGPSATMSFRLGPTQSRLAVDYRWRVAGDAEPASGPALTISAGF